MLFTFIIFCGYVNTNVNELRKTQVMADAVFHPGGNFPVTVAMLSIARGGVSWSCTGKVWQCVGLSADPVERFTNSADI